MQRALTVPAFLALQVFYVGSFRSFLVVLTVLDGAHSEKSLQLALAAAESRARTSRIPAQRCRTARRAARTSGVRSGVVRRHRAPLMSWVLGGSGTASGLPLRTSRRVAELQEGSGDFRRKTSRRNVHNILRTPVIALVCTV